MKLPKLYKKSATAQIQEWEVETEGNDIITRWGVVGGATQVARDTITKGKNIGKKNETTPTQQAQSEATSLWEKKKKKGYVESYEDARRGKTDTLIEGGIFPMLAHVHSKHGHKIQWPAYAQPKLDGHRCILVMKDGKATMWTRTRKPILCLPHILEAFENLVDGDAIFDGELYTHGEHTFEELTSYIKQQKNPKEGYETIEYWVYDFPHEADFKDRLDVLTEFFDEQVPSNSPVNLVPTVPVNSGEHAIELFQEYLDQGYEGMMLRNAHGPYVGKRSYDLQKVKTFDDAEFEVIGVEEGRGKMAGLAMFVCQTKTGAKFSAKMKGELEELRKYVDDPSLAIGRTVTIQYQGLTSAQEVPRFPVVLRFRDEE